MKTQTIRLLDVFVIGPYMIYIARYPGPPLWMRTGLVLTGLATIVYNLQNWERARKHS